MHDPSWQVSANARRRESRWPLPEEANAPDEGHRCPEQRHHTDAQAPPQSLAFGRRGRGPAACPFVIGPANEERRLVHGMTLGKQAIAVVAAGDEVQSFPDMRDEPLRR